MKNFIKNLVSGFLNVFALVVPKKRVAILMYHSVERNNIPSTVSPENFAQQMAYLQKKQYQVISLASLVDILEKKQPLPAKAVVISFDDGYQDNFIFAWPILQKYNFPATIFLTNGTVGGEKIKKNGQRLKMLAWPEIAKMQNSGLINFQPHTISHPRLSE
ncbi:MAG: polysaccharide deacetylase family protein, partial [Patescibacteria group bacterium]